MLVFFVSVVVGFIIFKLLFDAVLFNGRYYFKKRYEKALRMHELKAIQETDVFKYPIFCLHLIFNAKAK